MSCRTANKFASVFLVASVTSRVTNHKIEMSFEDTLYGLGANYGFTDPNHAVGSIDPTDYFGDKNETIAAVVAGSSRSNLKTAIWVLAGISAVLLIALIGSSIAGASTNVKVGFGVTFGIMAFITICTMIYRSTVPPSLLDDLEIDLPGGGKFNGKQALTGLYGTAAQLAAKFL